MALARKIPSKIYEISAHTQKTTCLDIGETGRVLVTGGQDRLVNLFAIGNSQCSMSLDGHSTAVQCVRFAYSDDFVYSAEENGIIKKWDLNQCENNSTFHGHMKSVRSIDFHPFGEYLVSGSHDTSVRLWDIRTNACIKKYRGHIANVNSVKFSPDGSWIASAGTEGSVIIWDIRMSNKLIEFIENGSPVTCLQFHPFEFLLAAGRNDGSVDLYDLESKQMISRIDGSISGGNAVKCITFGENGDCLFVGTTQNVSVIGWEPDREFDRIESTWTSLGDMKIVNKRLICGGFENRNVSIHAMNLDLVFPFYDPSSVVFNHNQNTRKSFSKGNGKLRLSIGHKKLSTKDHGSSSSNPINATINEAFTIESAGNSSPNLSIEMIDEDVELESLPDKQFEFSTYALSKYKNSIDYGNNLTSNGEEKYQLSKIINDNETTTIVHGFPLADPESDGFNYKPTNIDITGYSSDLDYYSSSRNILHNVSAHEDFTVNSAHPPDYAPKLPSKAIASKQKQLENHDKRRSSPPNMPMRPSSLRKTTTSVSTMDLRKIDEQFSTISTSSSRKPVSRGSSPIRNSSTINSKIRKSESSYQIKNQNQKNVSVQFFTKPQRSKTTLELKAAPRTLPSSIPRSIPPQSPVSHQHQPQYHQQLPPHHQMQHQQQSQSQSQHQQMQHQQQSQSQHQQMQHQQMHHHQSTNVVMSENVTSSIYTSTYESANESNELHVLTSCHDTVFNSLCNRVTSLEMIRNQMRSQDLLAAIRAASRIKDNSVIVDLLGAILERQSAWTLDMCILVLPPIYDLLQSDFKFHCQRACDSLRIIIKEFLPVIQANVDPWAHARLGADIAREERQNKCIECRNWLMKIRCLPENEKIGSSLLPLQNMIVDI